MLFLLSLLETKKKIVKEKNIVYFHPFSAFQILFITFSLKTTDLFIIYCGLFYNKLLVFTSHVRFCSATFGSYLLSSSEERNVLPPASLRAPHVFNLWTFIWLFIPVITQVSSNKVFMISYFRTRCLSFLAFMSFYFYVGAVCLF